jgi:hypothetical protein
MSGEHLRLSCMRAHQRAPVTFCNSEEDVALMKDVSSLKTVTRNESVRSQVFFGVAAGNRGWV